MEEFISSEILSVLQPNEPSKSTSSSIKRPVSPKRPPKHQRFSTVSEKEIEESITNRIPINTKKNTTWSHNVWKEWCQERNIEEPIITMEEKNINKLMSRFVQEVKRKDGNPYPPSTLVSLVSGIQRYLRENGCGGKTVCLAPCQLYQPDTASQKPSLSLGAR